MEAGARSTVVVWLVAAALAVFAATRLFGGSDGAPAPVRMDGPGPARRDAAADLYVHVAGAVRAPGLIRVRPDTRVAYRTGARREGRFRAPT